MSKSLRAAAAVLMFVGASGCQRSSSAAPRETLPRAAIASAASSSTPSPAPPEPDMDTTVYKKPDIAELKQKLTPVEFEVTQHAATEPPFQNAFWDNHARGIYVDVATGEPLFSSLDKFNSGTGWPSFTRPIDDGRVVSKTDRTFGMARTEVLSNAGNSHLGHVFGDGPPPTGERYCINSASLRFVPEDRLDAEGYGGYKSRFTGQGGATTASSTPPAATTNSCATPPPGERGERPGCEATLDTAILGGGPRERDALRVVPGVLSADAGRAAGAAAVRVVFDPKQITFAGLLDRWAAIEAQAHAPRLDVICTSDDQKHAVDVWKGHAADPSTRGRIHVQTSNPSAFTRDPS